MIVNHHYCLIHREKLVSLKTLILYFNFRNNSEYKDLDKFSFFETVEKFHDRAAAILEPSLVETVKGRMNVDEKRQRIRGILNMIKPCNRIIEFSFPIKRDNGNFETIQAFRAQHSDHFSPSKGGQMQFVLLTSINWTTRVAFLEFPVVTA